MPDEQQDEVQEPFDDELDFDVDPSEVAADYDDVEDDPTAHMTEAELADMAWEAQQAQEEYEAGLVHDAIRNISKESARAYLVKYGDAVDARIGACLEQGEALAKLDYFGPALTLATSAVEIAIRFLLLRPLVQGAFLSDRWAAILANRIAIGRTAEDRELLPAILREWGLDVTKVMTGGGVQVWPFVMGRMWPLRDQFVHRADSVDAKSATQAIDCARTFRSEVVGQVAQKLGFTLETTGQWSVITKGKETQKFEAADPFAELAAKGKKK